MKKTAQKISEKEGGGGRSSKKTFQKEYVVN